ncbi:MAG: division/cell wall cluster transcriptional repressor MraZ [Ruminococcus sp.]|nr:division/cell wall cluster transcriptional repressor MraZ [Ruminococcus sp.]
MSLKGTFYQSMDAKGRMTFPAKLREIIGESFTITKGGDGCLLVYSNEDFERLSEAVRKLSSKDRNVQRLLMGNANEVEADKQGRILIPPTLRAYAGLDKEVAVVGVSNRCEIWDRQKWDSFNDSADIGALLDTLEGIDL